MPSGNTNIMKKYKNCYIEIHKNFLSTIRIKSDKDSIEKFTQNCEGGYGIEQEIDSQKNELKKCKSFVNELTLVLGTNQLVEDSEYREYIQEVESYIPEYQATIDELSRLLPYT